LTWITDGSGTRWIDMPERIKRPGGRRRFENVKVGDFIMKDRITHWVGNRGSGSSKSREYAVVTDLWFDPAKGQHDHERGEMVAIQWVLDGKVAGSKSPHTIRGLATNGYVYADRDPIAEHQLKLQAKQEGVLVGVGHGFTTRRRPKQPGGGI
jgi:hypothetical protein